MNGRLYGIGVGPGDPELLTIKAKKILEDVDFIFTPQARKKGRSLALSIIDEVVDYTGKVEKLYFPMTYQQKKLEEARDKATDRIIKYLKEDKKMAFITLGDPMLYSTYQYIYQRLKKKGVEKKVKTIPGITSINASTSRLNLPLVKEEEKVAIVSDISDLKEFENIINQFETTVVMKLSRNLPTALRVLRKLKLIDNSVLVSRCGQENEEIIYNLDSVDSDEIDYLSLLIIKQERIS